MSNVTRAELEACARLFGDRPDSVRFSSDDYLLEGYSMPSIQLALARAAKLCVDWGGCTVVYETATPYVFKTLTWPTDGTEAECIIKAAASVQIEREKRNG